MKGSLTVADLKNPSFGLSVILEQFEALVVKGHYASLEEVVEAHNNAGDKRGTFFRRHQLADQVGVKIADLEQYLKDNPIRFSDLKIGDKFNIAETPTPLEKICANAATPMPYTGSLISFNDPDEKVNITP